MVLSRKSHTNFVVRMLPGQTYLHAHAISTYIYIYICNDVSLVTDDQGNACTLTLLLVVWRSKMICPWSMLVGEVTYLP